MKEFAFIFKETDDGIGIDYVLISDDEPTTMELIGSLEMAKHHVIHDSIHGVVEKHNAETGGLVC